VSLEGSLSEREARKYPDEKKVFALLRGVFACLTTAMRYEPANARYFQVEINCGNSMVETIKLLGCFSMEERPELRPAKKKPRSDCRKAFQDIFTCDTNSDEFRRVVESIAVPARMVSACVVLRMLYDMAVDNYDKTRPTSASQLRQQQDGNAAAAAAAASSPTVSPVDQVKKKKIPSLNLTPIPPDPVVVHAGIVTTMLKLLPLLHYDDESAVDGELATALQQHAAEMIKSLLRTEKNQQIMCEVGLLSDIFTLCKVALDDEEHVLHETFQYLLERLSAQKLEPKNLVRKCSCNYILIST
jgi:hypothetical protein